MRVARTRARPTARARAPAGWPAWRPGPRAAAARRPGRPVRAPRRAWLRPGRRVVTRPLASASARGHRPAGEDQLHRLGLADRPRQPLRATGAGHDAELDLRLAELGILGGHDHVADHRQLAAAAEREAADGRDERRADRGDPLPAREAALDGQADRRLGGELADVGAGGKRARPAPVSDDRPASRIAIERSSVAASSSSRSKLSALSASRRSIVTSATCSMRAARAGRRELGADELSLVRWTPSRPARYRSLDPPCALTVSMPVEQIALRERTGRTGTRAPISAPGRPRPR